MAARLVSAGQDGTGLVWNVSELKVPAPPPTKAARLDALGDPLPDGVTTCLGSTRWQVDSGLRDPRLSPDGKMMAAACQETSDVRAWSAATGKELWRSRLSGASTDLLAFTSDGKLILAGERAGVAILKADSGEIIRRLQGEYTVLTAVALSPDDRLIATAEDGGPEFSPCIVRLWDLREGRPLRTFLGQRSLVSRLAFSADGRRLLSSSPNARQREDGDGGGAVIVWDLATGNRLYHLPAREAVEFSPDGRLLAYRLDASAICVDDLRARRTLSHSLQRGDDLAFFAGRQTAGDGPSAGAAARVGHRDRQGSRRPAWLGPQRWFADELFGRRPPIADARRRSFAPVGHGPRRGNPSVSRTSPDHHFPGLLPRWPDPLDRQPRSDGAPVGRA